MSWLKFCWLQSVVSFSPSKINASLLEQNQSNKNHCTDVLGKDEDRFSLADLFNTCDSLLRATASRPVFLSSGSDLGGMCDHRAHFLAALQHCQVSSEMFSLPFYPAHYLPSKADAVFDGIELEPRGSD